MLHKLSASESTMTHKRLAALLAGSAVVHACTAFVQERSDGDHVITLTAFPRPAALHLDLATTP